MSGEALVPRLRAALVSLFPELCDAVLDASILGRARRRGLVEISVRTPRDWAGGRHRVVDDRPYGGGPGMVLAAPPVAACLDALQVQMPRARLLMTSPQGRRLDQDRLRELSRESQLIILCGHYEGFDERIVQLYRPEEFSLGDYVLSGGELPALTLLDGLVRLLPGVLGNEASAVDDSFGDDGLLDHPCYTKPRVFRELQVPPVLCSGDHEAIAAWRREQRLQRTQARRPDLEQP
ncbi:MAG: tRNA (guanosine(37)-N1)-methyltransferase TrmD [Planctomycetota bacterium]